MWQQSLSKNRLKYKALLAKFVTVDSNESFSSDSAAISDATKTTKSSLNSGKLNMVSEEALLDPLSDSWYGPGDEKLTDEQLLDIINKDVERTYPDIDFFRDEKIQKSLTNILFVYAKVNQDISYKQGMHELAAPMLWVLAQDAHAINSEDLVFSNMFDVASIEADAYDLFNQVMKSAKAWYLNDAETVPPIVAKSIHIQDGLLQRADPELYDTLKENSIEPQIWGIRWIRLLFGREFGFENMLALWDSLFANFEHRPDETDDQLEIIDYVCVVMLLRVRNLIINGDHTDILTTLLNYPVEDQTYETMYLYVTNASYLQRNLSSSAGKYISDQYNKNNTKGNDIRNDFANSPHETPISRTNSNSAITNRPLSRAGFDSLMDKAKTYSKSVIDQTQKWDVDRIVRKKLIDVRTKAKHGLDNAIHAKMQVETPSSTSGTHQETNNGTIAKRDLRDENLAAIIARALSVLEVEIHESADRINIEAAADAMQSLRQVEKCLRDPSALIPTDGITKLHPSTAPTTPNLRPEEVKETGKAVLESGIMSLIDPVRSRSSSFAKLLNREPSTPTILQSELSTPSGQRNESTDFFSRTQTSTVTTTPKTAYTTNGGESTDSTPTKATFKSPGRTSLAQREFSWMVSDVSNTPSSGFVRSKVSGGASRKKKMLFGGVVSSNNSSTSSSSSGNSSRLDKSSASSATDISDSVGAGLETAAVPEEADDNTLFELK